MSLLPLLALVASAHSAGIDASLDDCVQRVDAHPADPGAWSCFLNIAHVSGCPEAVDRRLAALAAADQSDGWPLIERGHLAQAFGWAGIEERYAEALDRFEGSGDHTGAANTWLSLSEIRQRHGQVAEAMDAVVRATQENQAVGDPVIAAQARLDEARIEWWQTGDLARARRLLDEAEPALSRQADPGAMATLLDIRVGVLLDLGDPVEAIRTAQRLVALAESTEATYDDAFAHADLADCLERYPDLVQWMGTPSAEDEARLVIRLSVASHNPYAEAFGWCVLGRMLPTAEGEAATERCLRIFTDAGSISGQVYPLRDLAARLHAEGPDRARALADQAIALTQRQHTPWEESEARMLRTALAWESEPRSVAVAASEALLDTIDQLWERQSLISARVGLAACWDKAGDLVADRMLGEDPPDFSGAIQILERQRARELRQRLLAAAVDLLDAERGGAVELPALQDLLMPDQALLVFQVAEPDRVVPLASGHSHVLVVTRSAVSSHPLPGEGELARDVDLLAGLVVDDEVHANVIAARLYASILGPALGDLPPDVDELVLVPDGPLHRLPFSLLRASPREPPLADRFALSRVPSLALWSHWRRRVRPRFPEAALALGIRQVPGENALPDLPLVGQEARRVVDIVGGTSLLGVDASESALKTVDLSRYAILHLAGHAMVDPSDPSHSALLLAPGRSSEDGRLQPAEIARLHLDDSLVVLSACSGAAGRVIGGEGPLDLVRAFHAAGARAVVASLWPLRDDHAEALMEAFYGSLASGASVTRALAEARRGDVPEAAWGALVLIGDGGFNPVAAPRESLARRGIGALILLAVGVLMLIVIRKGA